MIARVLTLAALAIALGVGGALAFVRFELRPRQARPDPSVTGLPVESVVIASRSGARLAGWFVQGKGRGAVLLLHGVKSNRSVLIPRMRLLNEAGYATLAIDFQAHGESSGDRITFGALEALDARSALDWLRARLGPGKPVAVLGVSMGGAAALIGEPLAASAVIVESTFPDLETAVSNRLALVLGPPGRAVTPLVLAAIRLVGGFDPAKLRPIEGIALLHVPILVMTGAEDRKTTVDESGALFARANPPKSYWEAPGAGHVDLMEAGGAAYRERLLAFLDSTLRAGPD
jgi:pimeloyl-ACP methyl ester carboxylesterase